MFLFGAAATTNLPCFPFVDFFPADHYCSDYYFWCRWNSLPGTNSTDLKLICKRYFIGFKLFTTIIISVRNKLYQQLISNKIQEIYDFRICKSVWFREIGPVEKLAPLFSQKFGIVEAIRIVRNKFVSKLESFRRSACRRWSTFLTTF